MELEYGLDWGPEIAAANLPPGRLGGKLTCLLPAGLGVGCPAVRGGSEAQLAVTVSEVVETVGEAVTCPPVAGGGPEFTAAASVRL